MVSVDVKATLNLCIEERRSFESRGGRPAPKSPYGLCGHKATLNYSQVSKKHTGFGEAVLILRIQINKILVLAKRQKYLDWWM